jgi:hypothetical protein
MAQENERLAELVGLLDNGDASVRQGALKGICLSFVKTTRLTKSDIRQVSRDFAPVVNNQQAPKSKARTAKDRDGPLARAIKSDLQTYPLNSRGPGSQYATDIRAARARDRANA